MADEVRARLSPHLPPAQPSPPPSLKPPPTELFPGLSESVPSAAWCREREHCHTLEDYLRRRTNIDQWIPRGGLGVRSQNTETLRQIARVFCRNEAAVDETIAACQRRVREQHDDILAAV
jgi:glycerol-3-phosphate dehydrogenase